MSTGPVILWLRRDLRLDDNAALAAANASVRRVLPVYVYDDATPGAWALGGAAKWWLHHSLAALGKALGGVGAPLVLRRGRVGSVLPALVRETGAAAIFAGQPVEPWAREAVADVERVARVPVELHRTATLFDFDAIRTGAGGPYGAYTPFARACRARLPDCWLHQPWAAPGLVLETAGVRLGATYPAPIVDLAAGRAWALEAFAALGAA